MRLLADFDVDSDMCLVEGAAPIVVTGPDGTFSLTLSNAGRESGAVLSAVLVFEADGLNKNTADNAEEKLLDALNVLAYTTNRKFAGKKLKRLIDWTPGIIDREAFVYAHRPVWDSAEPTLDDKFTDTATKLLARMSGEEQQAALRWYRLGIKEESLEQQFSFFWFALEIAAEATKKPQKVVGKCPVCRGKLFCQACNTHPTHRPYRGEVIEKLIERIHPSDSREVFETLRHVRHALMHGGRIEFLTLPCTGQQAVSKLATIAHRAIFLMFKPFTADEVLHMGYVDDVSRRTLVVEAHMRTRLLPRGNPNDPQLKDFPTLNAEIRDASDSSRDGPVG